MNFSIFSLYESFPSIYFFRQNVIIYMEKVNVSHLMPYFPIFHLIENENYLKKKKIEFRIDFILFLTS